MCAARMNRFAVQWLVPAQPDRLTHVMLLDAERPAPYVLAVGHGPDKVDALLTLWRTLNESSLARHPKLAHDRATARAKRSAVPS